MDAWTALWFWPLTNANGAIPPTVEQWMNACQQLLGREPEARKKSSGMTTLGAATNWDDLNDAEDLNLDFSGAVDVDEVLEKAPVAQGLRVGRRNSRASSTGNSTSRPSSPAAVLTFSSVTHPG